MTQAQLNKKIHHLQEKMIKIEFELRTLPPRESNRTIWAQTRGILSKSKGQALRRHVRNLRSEWDRRFFQQA